jgi:hypothetical protein
MLLHKTPTLKIIVATRQTPSLDVTAAKAENSRQPPGILHLSFRLPFPTQKNNSDSHLSIEAFNALPGS